MKEPKANITIINETDINIPLTERIAVETVKIIERYEKSIFSFVEVVYVDEPEIITINQQYLGHDYVTDIITFGYNESGDMAPLEGTLFCCAPRIIEQAKELKVDVTSEFLRVFIHGLLHLTGYDDSLEEQKAIMREKESLYINYAVKSYAK